MLERHVEKLIVVQTKDLPTDDGRTADQLFETVLISTDIKSQVRLRIWALVLKNRFVVIFSLLLCNLV